MNSKNKLLHKDFKDEINNNEILPIEISNGAKAAYYLKYMFDTDNRHST